MGLESQDGQLNCPYGMGPVRHTQTVWKVGGMKLVAQQWTRDVPSLKLVHGTNGGASLTTIAEAFLGFLSGILSRGLRSHHGEAPGLWALFLVLFMKSC